MPHPKWWANGRTFVDECEGTGASEDLCRSERGELRKKDAIYLQLMRFPSDVRTKSQASFLRRVCFYGRESWRVAGALLPRLLSIFKE